MGRALHDAESEAKAVFAEADQTLGFSLSKLCFEGPEDQLMLTVRIAGCALAVSIS